MKLSEQLQQINDSGDVGDYINGLADKAKMLEDALQYIVNHYNMNRGIVSFNHATIVAKRALEETDK